VSSLSEILSVSEVTVRKDLEKLENDLFLIRTHGGAVIKEDLSRDEEKALLDAPNMDSKRMVGLFAAALVQDRETIFLGGGSSCLQIAKNLHDKKDIIVITNNLSIMMELAGSPNCKVLATGGEIDSSEYGIMMTGEILLGNIRNMYFNKAFISVDAISMKRGFMLRNAFLSRLYLEIKNLTDEMIVVADHTKFDKNALSVIGDLSFADKVISDQLTPHEYIKYFFENDTQVYTTYPLK
ncbi:MAG: DeoR/GlpR family DNA-binding transcription regulator, partial [Eubacteriales bacterium]